MAQGSSRLRVDKEAVKDISRSEWQIIQTVGSGMSNKEIAAKLNMSLSGVKQALTAISDKTGVGRSEFAAFL